MKPEDFAREHGAPLLRLALMLTGRVADAEDLVQETFVRLLRHWSRLDAADAPRAYARRTLVNVFLSERRRRGHEVSMSDVPEPSTEVGGSRTDEAWALLATLPPRQRCVLALRYYDDLDDPHIASLMSITPGSVRSHAARGLATLRAGVPARKDRHA